MARRRAGGRGRAISIHALREEGDRRTGSFCCSCTISIHALREEGDGHAAEVRGGPIQFLSTPSARRATNISKTINFTIDDFYPRPPRGGRRYKELIHYAGFLISIHALREEGDSSMSSSRIGETDFYPRPPRGGRRDFQAGARNGVVISIHALREEGDSVDRKYIGKPIGFLSTPSARRATHQSRETPGQGNQFLSTPSARRATSIRRRVYRWIQFLSTPSARRATLSVW